MAQFHKNLTLTLGLISVLILASCKVNGYRNGLRTGLWVTQDDSGKLGFKSKGRYKKDIEKGFWKYFNNDTLYQKDKYRGNRGKVFLYHPNQKVRAKGKTKLELNGKLLHWYYNGDWKYFNTQGKLLKVVTYKKGNLVAEAPSNKPTTIRPTN